MSNFLPPLPASCFVSTGISFSSLSLSFSFAASALCVCALADLFCFAFVVWSFKSGLLWSFGVQLRSSLVDIRAPVEYNLLRAIIQALLPTINAELAMNLFTAVLTQVSLAVSTPPANLFTGVVSVFSPSHLSFCFSFSPLTALPLYRLPPSSPGSSDIDDSYRNLPCGRGRVSEQG